MRGRYSTWTRNRVNLRHVPEAQRPPQANPIPDEVPEWTGPVRKQRRPRQEWVPKTCGWGTRSSGGRKGRSRGAGTRAVAQDARKADPEKKPEWGHPMDDDLSMGTRHERGTLGLEAPPEIPSARFSCLAAEQVPNALRRAAFTSWLPSRPSAPGRIAFSSSASGSCTKGSDWRNRACRVSVRIRLHK